MMHYLQPRNRTKKCGKHKIPLLHGQIYYTFYVDEFYVYKVPGQKVKVMKYTENHTPNLSYEFLKVYLPVVQV